MEQYVKRTQRDYSMSFKLSVVRQIERGEMTYIEAIKHYGIQGNGTVLNWLRKHSTMDWCTLGVDSRKRSTPHMDKEPLTPEQRIKELEVQLLAAQQKAKLFEAMVEVINTQYPTIAKKSLGKSSKPSKPKKP
jgi:transposase-like protein